MTQNITLTIDGLFLHDTQMAELEREQTALKKIFYRAQRKAMLPFSFTQPFCPVAQDIPQSGKLAIAAPVARSGWIIRPVAAADGHSAVTAVNTAPPLQVPGYPPLPGESAFILGYAGDEAEALVAELSRDARTPEFASGFTVNARYRARLTLECRHDPGQQFSCFSSIGPARWEKGYGDL